MDQDEDVISPASVETEEVKEQKEPGSQLQPYYFKKGNKGGGGAYKKGKQMLKTLLKKLLEDKIDIENPLTLEQCRITVAEAMVLKLMKRALSGNLKAIELIFDRIEGKVADQLQLANSEAGPFEITSGPRYDFSQLTTDELTVMHGLLQKTASTVTDVDTVEDSSEIEVIKDPEQ